MCIRDRIYSFLAETGNNGGLFVIEFISEFDSQINIFTAIKNKECLIRNIFRIRGIARPIWPGYRLHNLHIEIIFVC